MKNLFKQRGQVLLLMVLLSSFTALAIVFGLISPIVRQIQMAKGLELSKRSYYAAESGSEDAYYRIKNGLPNSFPNVLALDDSSAEVSVNTIGPNELEIVSRGDASNVIRTILKEITVTDGFSFTFAVQVGPGGLHMYNGSSIIGNVYSDGPVLGYNTNPQSYNYVHGGAVSSSPTGLANQIHATGTVYSHSITNSTIDKDAYYADTLENTTVSGSIFPNSPDQPPVEMPIPDSLIEEWRLQAEAGGVISSPCPYAISTSTSIGPKKINCDVVISGNNTVVTLAGPLWIRGNLNIRNAVQMKVDDAIGNKSVPVIAADPINQAITGTILLENNTSFFGSTGNKDSYILLISENNSAESGGTNLAFQVVNGAAGNVLVYAPHGEIVLENNVALREVTAYKLTLRNNSQVIYTIGLAQPLFTTGPGGTWKIRKWRESY